MKSEFPEKKQRLLDTAKGLMIQNGFVATTVDEICKAAGVTKGSFFYYFKNKEDLGKTLITLAGSCCDLENADNNGLGVSIDPLERLYRTIDFMIEMSKDDCGQGCLVGTFAQEISGSHPELREMCADFFEKGIARFRSDLVAAKERYAPESDLDLEGLAESFVATVQGALILIKAKQDSGIMERTLLHYRRYLEGVFTE